MPVLTGYYRYTDIWFEWPKVLPNPEDKFPLKAILAHDSLIHPDNPLHVDNVNGVQMYLGQMQTGESRLLFSSAQVDYVRYWLKATGLTKTLIPLPYSDCLLTNTELRNVSTVIYKDGGSLRQAIKKIDKINKRLKGSNPLLSNRRELFERVRTLWQTKQGVWCAMDFEAWERDHQVITECGWRLLYWKGGEEVEEANHLIVEEHKKYRNTQYVPDFRYDYAFGESNIVPRSVFKQKVCNMISSLQHRGPVFLVFHDNNQDIKYLQSPLIAAPLTGLTHLLPDTMPNEGLFVVDTSDLYAGLEGSGSRNRKSLDRVCKQMQIPTKFLHNAGNDAYYTFEVLKSMASGNALDIQREERWPNRSNGVIVQFEAWEEKTDSSDDEIYPRDAVFGENGAEKGATGVDDSMTCNPRQ
ncbi:hypothetical protein AX17_000949 [Amanita inopinata Kibby_2008]|nr:hypothetical protein AX17_000949 [Amanita inopinata Kibby_2008]